MAFHGDLPSVCSASWGEGSPLYWVADRPNSRTTGVYSIIECVGGLPAVPGVSARPRVAAVRGH